MVEGRNRVIIENAKPEINSGVFPIKRVIAKVCKGYFSGNVTAWLFLF